MKSNKGATIIEIVIYTFLSITLLLVLTDIFSSLLDKSSESISLSEVEIDGKFISQKIYNQLPQASAITVPADLNTPTSTLSFTSGGINYSYFLTGPDLYISENGTPYRLNSYGTRVLGLSFNKLGNLGGKPLIKINFDVIATINRNNTFEEHYFELNVGTR